jgi:transposase-like protein
MKRTRAGAIRNVSLLVAIGVNDDGFRELLGICEGAKEDKLAGRCSCANWWTAP